MARKLDEELFQVGALSLAKCHLHSGRDIREMAQELWNDYGRKHQDPDALADWVRSATTIVAYLRDEIHHPHAMAFIHHAQFYCRYYRNNGEKRNRGLLRTLFTVPEPQVPSVDRISDLIHKVKVYQISLDAGLPVPEAPDGWTL